MQHGTNNRAWRVEAVDGQMYILRVLPGEEVLPRVRYEAALLSALSEKELPFRLPSPLRARYGDIVVPFEQETGCSAIATLHPFFIGIVLDRTDLIKAALDGALAGAALAALDGALATLPEQLARQPQALATFAELAYFQKTA